MLFRILYALTMVVSLFIAAPVLAQGAGLEPCEIKMAGSPLNIKTCNERRANCEKEKDSFRRDACLARAAENDAFSAHTENMKTRALLRADTASTAARFDRVTTATTVLGTVIKDHSVKIGVVQAILGSFEGSIAAQAAMLPNGDVFFGVSGQGKIAIDETFVLGGGGLIGSAMAASPRGYNLGYGGNAFFALRGSFSQGKHVLDFGLTGYFLYNQGTSLPTNALEFMGVGPAVHLGLWRHFFAEVAWLPLNQQREIGREEWAAQAPTTFVVSAGARLSLADLFLKK